MLDLTTRWQGVGVGALVLLMTALEAVGIGLIFPFIKFVTEPDLLREEKWIAPVVELFPNLEANYFLAFLALALASVFVVKNCVTLAVQYYQAVFNSKNEALLAGRLFFYYMNGDYALHLNRNSSEFIRNIMGAASTVFTGVVYSIITLVAELCIVAALVVILFIASPFLTAIAAGALIIIGSCFYWVTRNRFAELGKSLQELNARTLQILQQGLHSIKEMRVLGRQAVFIEEFCEYKQQMARVQALYSTLSFAPRSWIESTMVGGMLIIVAMLLLEDVEASEIFSTLALFGAAAFRMLPSANRIVISLTTIKNGMHAVSLVYGDLQQFGVSAMRNSILTDRTQLEFSNIAFENVGFTYPLAESYSLKDVSIQLDSGHSLGIIGPSGAGKTTLVDIFLGLFLPTEGTVKIDGRTIDANTEYLRNSVGYVPQSIYILDSTIRKNIAFGVPEGKIDNDQILNAIELAQLTSFLKTLPNGLDTGLGEHGMRLSGGQRQRIGIARALYANPKVLVLDEATAALDSETEHEINESIKLLKGKKTLIIIAHRLSTVRACEHLVMLEDGQVADHGTFDELQDRNARFQRMIKLSEL